MRRGFVIVVAVVASVALAQKPAAVTQLELSQATFRSAVVLAKTLTVTVPKAAKVPAKPAAAATRSDVIRALDSLLAMSKGKIRPSAKKLSLVGVSPKGLDKDAAGRVSTLVGWGLVGNADFVMKGPGATMTVNQVGDALGKCLARLLDLTHVPKKGYSPEFDRP